MPPSSRGPGVGIVGQAGRNDIRADRKFGTTRTSVGRKGEQMTASRIDELLRARPQVAIFHGIKLPGRKGADVDHLLVAGRTVVLIDSKLWKAGTYWRLGPWVMRGLSPYAPASKVPLGFEVAEIRRHLPGRTTVRAFVAAWGGGNKPINALCRVRGGYPIVPGARAAERALALLPDAPPAPDVLEAVMRLARRRR